MLGMNGALHTRMQPQCYTSLGCLYIITEAYPIFLKLEKLVNNLGFWMMASGTNIQD